MTLQGIQSPEVSMHKTDVKRIAHCSDAGNALMHQKSG